MCGISGYVDKAHRADREIISAMTETLVHRGPDDYGVECIGNVALGHRRLSIIDLSSAGRQPMADKDGNIWIVFNGEFYNFQYYRNELIKKGYKFRSKTDTEVIIYLYIEYGPEKMLEMMNGMYAFCIYDSIRQKIYLVRDRLGIKPCYYSLQGRLFLWGSELKAILKHPQLKTRIRLNGIKEYFNYMYIPDPNTIFEGIQKMMPGEYLEFDIPEFSLIRKRYWDVKFESDDRKHEAEWLDEIDSIMEDSVRKRLISDVPFGAFLSGGIDSSFVVSYMSRIMNNPVKTFSIGFQESSYSELPWARQVAKKYNTDHYEKTVLPNAVDLLPKLAFHYDEPFGDHSAVPTYYVSKIAREKVTVVLSGDGGDENFAGYPKYDMTLKLYKIRKTIPAFIRQSILKALNKCYPENMRGKSLFNIIVQDDDDIYHTKMLFFDSRSVRKLIKRDIMIDEVDDAFKQYFDRIKYSDFLSIMQYIDLKTYLPMDILTKVDKASMAVSLETRVPILDHRAVELAAKMPVKLQRKNNIKKYIMKKIMKEKFNFTDEFLYRGKQGFDLPIDEWFKGKLKDYAKKNLLGSDALISGYLDQKYVHNIIEKHSRGFRNYANLIWSILIFEHWLRIWGQYA